MDILKKLTEELGIQRWQAEAAVGLIDEGNTIPFISRYRKEVFKLCEAVIVRYTVNRGGTVLYLTPSARTAGGVFLFPFCPPAEKRFLRRT